jgi:hypothetical protein
MHVPVQESPAGKPAGPCRPAKYAGMAKHVLRNPQYVPVCTLQKRTKCSTKSRKRMYWYVLSTYQYIPFYEPEVCTGYILLTSSMYFKTYISYQYVLVYTWYILSTYLSVHTWGKNYVPGTYRFMSVYSCTIL